MVTILQGDALTVLRGMPAESVHCVVTSPPYWGLRDYGVAGQIGLEPTFAEWLDRMVEVFREVRRVLRADGTAWVNIGDAYVSGGGAGVQGKTVARAGRRHTQESVLGNTESATGLPRKNLIGMPWRLAFALQDDGWYLRSDIIWHKPNAMPESVKDRPTKAHEYLFLLSKSERYYYDAAAVREESSFHPSDWNSDGTQRRGSKVRGEFGGKNTVPGREGFRAISPLRNRRTVWSIPTEPFPGAHFATFPKALVVPCVLAGCPPGGTVLDPFGGSATVGEVAESLWRNSVLIELNPAYIEMGQRRTAQMGLFCRAGNGYKCSHSTERADP